MGKNDAWNKVKNSHLEKLLAFLAAEGEDVQQVASNKLVYPVVNDDGDEAFFTITLAKPNGSCDGEPYDGYAEAENYRIDIATKQKKAEKARADKEAKIERDRKFREKKSEIFAKKI